MATTFVSRKTIRDGLVTLFIADGNWQKVFGYFPTEDDIGGQEPFLVITSAGTEQEMESIDQNPSEYLFAFTSMVLMDDSDVGGSATNQTTEDKLDELDQKLRQIIRNNAGGAGIVDQLNFAGGASQTDIIVLYDVLYRTEMRVIKAVHESGS